MAPPTEPDDRSAESNDDPTTHHSWYDRSINRRSLLQLAGAGVLGGVVGVRTANAAAPSDVDISQEDGYEVWTVPAGETVVLELGDGDSVENVLIDQTADGANLYLSAPNNPSDWTIRNVGWKGIADATDIDGWAGLFQMCLSGDGLVENIFIDNRAPEGERGATYVGGGYLIPHHSGHVDVRNTFIAGCGNNAFYASKPGDGGDGGTITFSDCYHRDNTVSQFRIGTGGSRVENCIAVQNDSGGRRGTYPGYSHDDDSGKNARLVWGRHCDNLVTENCSFWQDPDDVRPDAAFMTKTESESICDDNVLTVRNFDINESVHDTRNGIESTRAGGTVDIGSYSYTPATDVLIEGVPGSPEEAARGERTVPDVPEFPTSDSSSGDSSEDDTSEGESLDRTLRIDGTDAGMTDYEFTVSGEIENDPDVGTFDEDDVIDGSTVSGFVNGGVDGYVFSGELTATTVDGDATVLVDGEPLDQSSSGDDTSDGGSLDRTLRIDGTDAGMTDYEFTVSGEIENDPDVGTFDEDDVIDGSTVSGFVNGGVDGYVFSGELTATTVDGDATVLVDGEPLEYAPTQSSPTIDQYEVTESGSRNPHADILVDWGVSDPDGDLSTLTVTVSDESGTLVDSTTRGLDGGEAYGVDYFKIKNVDGQTFEIETTVTDAVGNQSSRSERVQE